MGSAALDWVIAGYKNGDPVASALFVPLFIVLGLGQILQGKPF
ncbi:hypothetical protein [Nocardia stercoris]|nr:hypothetical protein [Nocardia stercoris]